MCSVSAAVAACTAVYGLLCCLPQVIGGNERETMTAGGPRGAAGPAGGRGGGGSESIGRPRAAFNTPPLNLDESFEDEGEDWEMDFMQEGMTGSTSASSLEDDGDDLPAVGGAGSRGDSMEKEPTTYTAKAQNNRGKGGSRGR